jgi:type VII secretion integral membrane protein EccD
MPAGLANGTGVGVKPLPRWDRMRGMSDSSPDQVLRGRGGPHQGTVAQEEDLAAMAGVVSLAGAEANSDAGQGPSGSGDLCRLSICGPASSVELAVPVHVPLVDLLPALAGHMGGNLADAGLEHEGWVLQRLGDRPLREELSIAALGLHDGDIVHLRPRSAQLPPLDFDDLIDGVASGIAGRHDRWRPDMSRRLLAGLLAVPLAAGAGLLAGHAGRPAVALGAGLALLLLVCATAASRAFGDRGTSWTLGVAAVTYAAIAGAQLPLLHGGVAILRGVSGPGPVLLAGGAAAAAAAILAALLIGGRDPGFAGLTAFAALVTVAGALASFAHIGGVAIAAVMLVVVVPLGAAVPTIAFRLTGLRLDPLPTTPDELQENLDPVPGEHVLERTRWADRYMSALYGALGAVAAGCLAVLGLAAGWKAHLVSIDATVLLLLHARLMVAARHKLAAVVPAVAGAIVLITAAGLRVTPHTRLLLLSGVMVAAGLLWAAERTLPGRKLVPIWGRLGDLLESLTAVALLPATLWLLNFYQIARAVRL